VRKLDKSLVKGFVAPDLFLQPEGVEIIDRDGHLLQIPLAEVKGVFFVRDFDGNPRRPERKAFLSRPRLGGLWVRLTFKDKEVLDGVISSNLLELHPAGFLVTPPDAYSNNLRMFIPRTALEKIEVLSVVPESIARGTVQLFRTTRSEPRGGSAAPSSFPSGTE